MNYSICYSRIAEIPNIRQRDDYSCGAAATMAVANHFGVGSNSLPEWKKLLQTDVHKSTKPANIIKTLRDLGLQVTYSDDLTVADLDKAVDSGSLIICPIQEYGAPDKRASFNYGHYVVVIGVLDNYIVVFDPSIDNVLEKDYTIHAPGKMLITVDDWMKNWHDVDADGNKLKQFGIIVSSKENNMNYSRAYVKAVKYSAGEFEVHSLEKQLTPDHLAGRQHVQELAKLVKGVTEPEWSTRLALADALNDTGREEEAQHVANIDQPIVKHNGVWKPGVVKWRDVLFTQSNPDYEELNNHVEEMGPEDTLKLIKNNYDYGSGILRKHHATNRMDHSYKEGDHVLSWRPAYEYVGVQARHIVPQDNSNHNYVNENGESTRIPEYGEP